MPQSSEFVQVGQGIVEPGDIRVGLALCQLTHLITGFNRNHIPAIFRQPIGIATGSGTNIAGETGFYGQMRRHPATVNRLRFNGVVLFAQCLGMLIVVASAFHRGSVSDIENISTYATRSGATTDK